MQALPATICGSLPRKRCRPVFDDFAEIDDSYPNRPEIPAIAVPCQPSLGRATHPARVQAGIKISELVLLGISDKGRDPLLCTFENVNGDASLAAGSLTMAAWWTAIRAGR